MKRRMFSMVLASAALGLVGCGGDRQTWRQKLRVVVSTPSGDVAGEAISEGFIKVRTGIETLGTGAGVYATITHGEATVVDLGNGRYLFALLDGTGDGTWYLPFYTFLDGFPSAKWANYVEAAHEFVQVKGPREIPRKRYPVLVAFGNVNDPKSVKEVKPDNLAAAFGPGYALESITLEITDEEVTSGKISEVLPWSLMLVGSIGKGTNLPFDHLLNKINDGSFHRGN